MRSGNLSVYGANSRLRYSILVLVHTFRGCSRYLADADLLSRECGVLVHRLSLLGLVAQLTFLLSRRNSFSSEPSLLAFNDRSVDDLSEAVVTRRRNPVRKASFKLINTKDAKNLRGIERQFNSQRGVRVSDSVRERIVQIWMRTARAFPTRNAALGLQIGKDFS
jgi:hypothetical protein